MSKLAQKIAKTDVPPPRVRMGPPNRCHPLYGDGDLDDWNAVEDLRAQGHNWRTVQQIVDNVAGIKDPLPLDKFRRHWRRRCFCWAEDIRQ